MGSILTTIINKKPESQDDQVIESKVMKVEGDSILDLVSIQQAPTNANPSATPFTHNQEAVPIPVSIPDLDREPASVNWDESDSESDLDWGSDSEAPRFRSSEYGDQTDDDESDIEESQGGGDMKTAIVTYDLRIPDQIHKGLFDSVSSPPYMDSFRYLLSQFPVAEMMAFEVKRWIYVDQTGGESDFEESQGEVPVRKARVVYQFPIPERVYRGMYRRFSSFSYMEAYQYIVSQFPGHPEIYDFTVRRVAEVNPTPTGMSQEEMDAIPEVTVNDGPLKFEGQETCSICTEDFVVGELARQPNCSHRFHQTCLWSWLNFHRTCPSCRHPL